MIIWFKDPLSNGIQKEDNSKNNSNMDPRNHSSHLISNSDILLSFFAKSNKQLGTTSPRILKGNNELKKSDFIDDANNLNSMQASEKKINKKLTFNKSLYISSAGIEEEKREDDGYDEKEQRLKKQKALEEAIRKDLERRKLKKTLQFGKKNS